jgi:DNA polymerase III delta prime subunit
MKQQHLSEALGLTDDQQAKIKPTLEQESGEAGTILWDPVLSRKDKLKRYEKLVAASDAKIKPILSTTQVDRLLELRKQQKAELRKLIAEQNAGKQN